MTYIAASFADLPGWRDDDHAAALSAFRLSTSALAKTSPQDAVAIRLSELARDAKTDSARQFFERNFTPHSIEHAASPGLLTGYFEPVVAGDRVPSAAFPVPLHRRPPDLVNLVSEADRGATTASLTHARRTPRGIEPFATRRDIDSGALDTAGLELLYVADIVDRFIIQVQGSAAIRMPDGAIVRITYDGKNGHPYTSIGRILIETGQVSADAMTLDTLISWLKSDLGRARDIIWRNASYVFFRELTAADGTGPLGVLNCTLTPGRSLAIDTAHHALGLPIFVSAPDLTHLAADRPFNRLMIAQDVGSAIKGPERGDIFVGTGDDAGRAAGAIKHAGRFFVLLPNSINGQ